MPCRGKRKHKLLHLSIQLTLCCCAKLSMLLKGTLLLSRPRWVIYQILVCQPQRFFPRGENDER